MMLKLTPKGIELAVLVTPKAQRSEIVGWKEGELRVRLAAIPAKGEANQELIRFLAKTLKIPKSQVELISGSTSRHKRIRLNGITKLPAGIPDS